MSRRRPPVIAIDGPGGVGKTTVSRLLARRLGLLYVDTGAMYRSIAVCAHDAGVSLGSDEAMAEFTSGLELAFDRSTGAFTINGVDYSGRIRTEEAGKLASIASARRPVRDILVSFQRTLGRDGGVVMEGRDIGTVVFPGADVKFFLDAPHGVRAQRRIKELEAKGGSAARDVGKVLKERDERDSTRANSPLTMAGDAIPVDTGESGIDEVVERLVSEIRKKTGA